MEYFGFGLEFYSRSKLGNFEWQKVSRLKSLAMILIWLTGVVWNAANASEEDAAQEQLRAAQSQAAELERIKQLPLHDRTKELKRQLEQLKQKKAEMDGSLKAQPSPNNATSQREPAGSAQLVEREMQSNDHRRSWHMYIAAHSITFSRIEVEPALPGAWPNTETQRLHFYGPEADGKVASEVFEKFLSWTATAKTNNAGDISKEIATGRKKPEPVSIMEFRFMFGHGEATFLCSGVTRAESESSRGSESNTAVFSQEDIEKFNALLKQLPEAKAELASAQAKRKRESELLK